jgi:hypothetical protein
MRVAATKRFSIVKQPFESSVRYRRGGTAGEDKRPASRRAIRQLYGGRIGAAGQPFAVALAPGFQDVDHRA